MKRPGVLRVALLRVFSGFCVFCLRLLSGGGGGGCGRTKQQVDFDSAVRFNARVRHLRLEASRWSARPCLIRQLMVNQGSAHIACVTSVMKSTLSYFFFFSTGCLQIHSTFDSSLLQLYIALRQRHSAAATAPGIF